MSSPPLVAIILINWNGITDTLECVDSLRKLTYGAYKIIVVDNASANNEAAQLKEKLNGIADVIAHSENSGFAEGNNIGIRWAKQAYAPAYFWLLNNDTLVDSAALTELVKSAETDNHGITGSFVRYWDSPLIYCLGGGVISLWTGIDKLIGSRIHYKKAFYPQKLSYVNGCSFLVRHDVVDRLNGFDVDYFLYSEEVDFCIRATRFGFSLGYSPSSTVFHKSGQSTGYDSYRYIYYFLRNKLLLMKKNARWWQYPSFIFFFVFYYCLGFMWRSWKKNGRFPLSIIYKSVADFLARRWSSQSITS